MHSADTHMNFDLDLAKERSEKNPVYYVQYAHARISSIFEKAKDLILRPSLGGAPRLGLGNVKERALIFELLKFPDLVEEISKNYAVHYLPQYAMGLADKFHSFYDECRVIDENNLELTAAALGTRKSGENCFGGSFEVDGNQRAGENVRISTNYEQLRKYEIYS